MVKNCNSILYIDKSTKESQQSLTRAKTEPKRNVAVVKRFSSPEPTNSRSILKKNLRSNISDEHRQEIKNETSDGNSGDEQDFGFDFQEAPLDEDLKEQISSENSSDIALAGFGDTEEYEIPDWALKPM
jgi:hypothetical protein